MDFKSILQACTSEDNQVRRQAEATLDAAKTNPQAVLSLVQELCSNEAANIRLLAAIVLNKWLPTAWPQLSEDLRVNLRNCLLSRSIEEPETSVRSSVFECIATLAINELPEDRWPQLLQSLLQFTTSQSHEHRARSISLLNVLADKVPGVMVNHVSDLHAVCMNGLKDPDTKVRRASLFAVSGVFGAPASAILVELKVLSVTFIPQHKSLVQQLMPPTLNVLEECIDESIASKGSALSDVHQGIILLLEVIEEPQAFLQQCMPRVIQIAMKTASSQNVDLELRGHACQMHLRVQIISWLATFKPRQLAHAASVPDVVSQLCTLATEVTPNSGDPSAILLDDADVDCPPPWVFTAQVLERCALGLPTKLVLPSVLKFFERAITHEGHVFRAAACHMLQMCMEGCTDGMRIKGRLKDALPLVARGVADPHPHVRASAASCVAEMACHLQPEMSDASDMVMPAMVAALANEDNAHVVQRVVEGLDNCMEHMQESALAQYLPQVMPHLLRLLAHGNAAMSRPLLSCVSSAAAAGGDGFQPFAAPVVEHLQKFMSLTAANGLPSRTAATECVGLVAETLGRSVAERLLPPFLEAAAAGFALSNPMLREYGHGLFASSARTLCDSFRPYLPKAFELAKNSIQSDSQADEDDKDEVEDEDEGEEDSEAGSLWRVRTGAVDEKAAALQAIGIYAECTGAAFLPYAEEAIKLCKAMADSMHADPRCQAVEALPKIVACIHVAVPAAPPELVAPPTATALGQTLPVLFLTVKSDFERPVVASAFTGFATLCSAGPQGALLHAAPALVDCIEGALRGSLTCQEDDEEDEGELDMEEQADGFDDMQEAEESLIESVCDTLVPLVTALGPDAFMEAWKAKLGKCFLEWMAPSQTDNMRSIFTGTFAELVSKLGPALSAYIPTFLPVFVKELENEVPQNRHHAVFGIGCMIEKCPEVMKDNVVELLQSAISPRLQDPADGVRDNACGAVARCVISHHSSLPVAEVLQALFTHLPLRRDYEEAAPIVEAFALLVESGNPNITSGEMLPPAVRTLACFAAHKSVDVEVRRRAARTIAALHARSSQEVDAVVQSLEAKQQDALRELHQESD